MSGKYNLFVGPFSGGTPVTGAHHDGNPGDKIADRIPSLGGFLTTYQPGLVTVLLGTNNTQSDADRDATTADYTSLLNTIRTNMPTVKIACILPLPTLDPTRTGRIASVIAQETAVVNARIAGGDSNLILIPTASMPTAQLEDGVHPSCDGYVTLGNIIWNGGLKSFY